MKRVTVYKVELVREKAKLYDIETNIKNSQQAPKVIREVLEIEKWHNEKFGMLCLDSKNKVIGVHIVAEGTVNETAVYIREVATRALLNNAVSIIVFHNHPGESTEPSAADVELTRKLKEGLKILKINLLDHIILTTEEHTSLADKGLL